MSVTGRPEPVPPQDEPARTQRALAAALWHYATTPVAKPYHVRGCVPDPAGPRVPVSATRIVVALPGPGRGNHAFGFTGHRFDGKRLLNGFERPGQSRRY
ncbi:hypothetical protein [Streptomyces griseus]|uniref:hypothetical protein n=1 Tax=Streptomyces griseus TaxID=1911 RepID=UPI00131ACC8B|nr:hypothetical protein [Streptomyces griseus]